MPDFRSYGGIGPWNFTGQPSKPNYNEGSMIAPNDNPVWVNPVSGGSPITPVHNPCGYWTQGPPSEYPEGGGPYVGPIPITESLTIIPDTDDGVWGNGLFGPASIGASFGLGGYSSDPYNAFFRFPGIQIPKDALILSAIIRFVAKSGWSGLVCNVNCSFNASDNAIAPINYTQAMALVSTTAVQWNAVPVWVENQIVYTPNMAAALQEIVNRPGWVIGNSIMALIKENNSTPYTYAIRKVNDYYNDPTKVASISISYI